MTTKKTEKSKTKLKAKPSLETHRVFKREEIGSGKNWP